MRIVPYRDLIKKVFFDVFQILDLIIYRTGITPTIDFF